MPCLSLWWCFFLFFTPSISLSLSFFFFLLPSLCLFSFLGEDGSSSALWKDSEVGECREATEGSDSTLVSSCMLEAPLRREMGSIFSVPGAWRLPDPWVASDSVCAGAGCWGSPRDSALASVWCLRLRVGEEMCGRGASPASGGCLRCREGELVAWESTGGWVESGCPRRFLLGDEASDVCATAAVGLSGKDVVVAVGAAVETLHCMETVGACGSGCSFLPRPDRVSGWTPWRASWGGSSGGPFLPRAATVVGDILFVGMGSANVLTGTFSDEVCSISPGDFFCFFGVVFLPSELLLLLPAIAAGSGGCSSGGPGTEATPGW